MSYWNKRNSQMLTRGLACLITAVLLPIATAYAAVPGITGTPSTTGLTFSLSAQDGYITQPDGVMIYSWGYGCNGAPAGFVPFPGNCPSMQIPGPTLVVNEGQTVTVTLANNLPPAAGNTSILFPGFQVTTSGGVAGLRTQEAVPGSSVTYNLITTGKAGTHAYYSGTQPDLQIEMGLYGAIVVLPATPATTCQAAPGTGAYKLAASAYDNLASTCYDREYLFQFAEIDPKIHRQAETQVLAQGAGTVPVGQALTVGTEPYHPTYFTINGRSMPDDMDPSYAPNYPHQPYNGNPHMHPGDLVLLRVIGVGHWQHPFHEHGNHVRILARDGNLILSQTDATKLAGRMEFTTDTTPGQAFDGIFYWSGRGLNWDIYGHTLPKASASIYSANATTAGSTTTVSLTVPGALPPQITTGANITVSGITVSGANPTGYDGMFTVTGVGPTTIPAVAGANPAVAASLVTYTDNNASGLPTYSQATSAASGTISVVASSTDPTPCVPDANGYYTVNSNPPAPPAAPNYYEWCADHNKPLETNPVGAVGGGGPATLFDPLVVTNGLWFNGTPYLGPDAVNRSRGPTPLPPSTAVQNPPAESGIAFMWHSHNEREITTNDIFPGGMLMMMLVDPPVWFIDETL
jgi:FtsP/CotA-like multicopper oxidase with cupredoxin domain